MIYDKFIIILVVINMTLLETRKQYNVSQIEATNRDCIGSMPSSLIRRLYK